MKIELKFMDREMQPIDADTKEIFADHAKKQMLQHLTIPSWTMLEKIAIASRILFAHGHDSHLAGQITARVKGAPHFITQRFGVGFDEVNVANLLVIDEELNVVRGDGMPNPANRFHSWIYRARPDVNCVVHTHPLHIAALSMLGRPLEISHMDTCLLYGDVAFLEAWPGVPIGDNEGEIIVTSLGKKRAVLLAHHGLLVASRSVEEACVVAMQCERAAQLQLLASAIGEIRKIDPRLGLEAHDWLLTEKRIQATFYYLARRVLKHSSDFLVSVA